MDHLWINFFLTIFRISRRMKKILDFRIKDIYKYFQQEVQNKYKTFLSNIHICALFRWCSEVEVILSEILTCSDNQSSINSMNFKISQKEPQNKTLPYNRTYLKDLWHYNLNKRKSEQAHIPHAPTLLEKAVYNKWQFQALVAGNRTENQFHLSCTK